MISDTVGTSGKLRNLLAEVTASGLIDPPWIVPASPAMPSAIIEIRPAMTSWSDWGDIGMRNESQLDAGFRAKQLNGRVRHSTARAPDIEKFAGTFLRQSDQFRQCAHAERRRDRDEKKGCSAIKPIGVRSRVTSKFNFCVTGKTSRLPVVA